MIFLGRYNKIIISNLFLIFFLDYFIKKILSKYNYKIFLNLNKLDKFYHLLSKNDFISIIIE